MILEKGTALFGRKNIDFFVKRSKKRKTVSIFVDPIEGVFLRAPIKPSLGLLSKLVRSKAVWILDKQHRINEILKGLAKREFVTGETFLYLGRQLRLKIIKSKSKQKINIIGSRFIANLNGHFGKANRGNLARDMLIDWYKKHAREILVKRIEIYSRKLKISAPKIMLASQAKRWGSCSSNGQIRFNWHIVMAPVALIDYVVAHELCHLKYISHSESFWKLLGNIMPDYEIRRERLRREGPNYIF